MKYFPQLKHRRIKAFTLVELLLVMLISSIIVLGVNSVYRQAYLVWARTEETRTVYHQVRLITESLREELTSLYLPQRQDAKGDNSKTGEFQPISVSSTELSFFTFNPRWNQNSAISRSAKVRYSFTYEQETGRPILLRSEQPYSTETPIGNERHEVIAKDLSEFAATAINKDSSEGQQGSDSIPEALRISLRWPGKGQRSEVYFQSVFLIPTSKTLSVQ